MNRHRWPHRLGAALASAALIAGMVRPAWAQLAVYDAATTARNTVTATVQQFLFEIERQQHTKLREMARRLSALTNLRKYAMEDVPRWRTHGGDFFYAQPYNDALIFGDSSGAAFAELSQRLLAESRLLDRLSPTARRIVQARLATVNLTDAAAIAATHGSGQLRLLGRRGELDRRYRADGRGRCSGQPQRLDGQGDGAPGQRAICEEHRFWRR